MQEKLQKTFSLNLIQVVSLQKSKGSNYSVNEKILILKQLSVLHCIDMYFKAFS